MSDTIDNSTMAEARATERPWVALIDDYGFANGRAYIVVDNGSQSLAAVWTTDGLGRDLPYKENASLIVTAVNERSALLECERALRAIRDSGSADAYSQAVVAGSAALDLLEEVRSHGK